MRSSSIPPSSAQPGAARRQPDVEMGTGVALGTSGKSDGATPDLRKAPARIQPQIKKAEGFTTAAFAMSSTHTVVPTAPVFDMAKINHDKNNIVRSSFGKTSGVLMVRNLTRASLIAVLKPVAENEVFANELFAKLDMPIPAFEVMDKNCFNDAINAEVRKNAPPSTLRSNKIMVMAHVSGRAMSEYGAAELTDFLLIDRNLELLGKSMALDAFAGNADRIVPFMANTVNPDNIMFQDKTVIFIDQAFRDRKGQNQRIFSRLADAVNTDGSVPGIDARPYRKYILPLVQRSLQKYKAELERTTREDLITVNSFETFKSSIDSKLEDKINERVTAGICSAIALLLYKKNDVLELSSSDENRQTCITNTYAGLEELSARFRGDQS